MADNWSSFKLGPAASTDVLSIATGLSGVIQTLNGILSTAEAALTLASATLNPAATDPIELLIKASIDELESLITGLLTETTAHAIFIPIQKQYFGKGVLIPGDRINPSEMLTSFDDLLDDGAFSGQRVADISPDVIPFINSAYQHTGGSQGFWRALVLSTRDSGDANRPVFPSEFALSGACILIGASTLADLSTPFQAFARIFNLGSRADLTNRTLPTIENVKTQIVPLTGDSRGIGVRISWDAVGPTFNFPLYSDEQFIVEELIVIRTTDPKAREANNWSDLFTEQPPSDRSALPANQYSTVVARLRNDGFVTDYIDENPAVDKNSVVYYCVAPRYTSEGVALPVTSLSAVQRVHYTAKPQTSRKSELPDWWATPTPVSLVKPLEGLLVQLQRLLEPLKSRSVSNSGPAAIVAQTIQQVQRLIDQGEAAAAELSANSDALRALAQIDLSATATVLSTNFSTSSGGMDGWTAELARRMADTSDPTRPVFANGDLVAGVVIVAGAPNLRDLDSFNALLEALFGSTEDNPILDAIDAIDASIPEPTVITFNDALTPSREASAPVTEPDKISFDSAMRPVDKPVDC